jgi:transposase InsO family protein
VVLDDFSRYIIAWKLCTTMKAADVTATLKMALDAAGLDKAKFLHRPRLLSDNGSSYISDDLAKWLENHDMAHVRGAPYHQAQIEAFVAHYNHRRYHESISNLTPADVYFGRGQIILLQRERIKHHTIAQRRL